MSAKCKCGHSRENHSVRGGFPFCEGTTMKACDCKGYEPQQSATHTPGPWEVVRAAAPELLEALKAIRDYDPSTSSEYHEATQARDAAFKATKECPECEEWRQRNHPIQKGICDTHWRQIWAAENLAAAAMDKSPKGAMRDIARAAIARVEGGQS